MCTQMIKEEILKSTPTSQIITKVVQEYGVSRNAAQKRVRKVREKMQRDNSTNVNTGDEDLIKESRSYNGNKEQTTFVGRIKMPKNGDVSPEQVLRAYGLDPSEWRVVNFKVNEWQGPVKGGGINNYQQFTLTVTPFVVDGISVKNLMECFDRYFEQKTSIATYKPKLRREENGGYIAEILIPDKHSNLHADKEETGFDYNSEIARQEFRYAIEEIIDKISLHKIPVAKFVVAVLGDVMHTDNNNQTTTKGTFQQVDSRIYTATLKMLEEFEWMLKSLAKIANVEFVYVYGNHDKTIGPLSMLALAGKMAADKRIEFDVSPMPHKFRRYGKTVLVWTHGDIGTDNIDNLAFNTVGNFSNEDVRRVHAGHVHHNKSRVSGNGTTVQFYGAICGESEWEHNRAFGNSDPVVEKIIDGQRVIRRRRALYCNIWNPTEAKAPEFVLSGSTC